MKRTVRGVGRYATNRKEKAFLKESCLLEEIKLEKECDELCQ